MNNSNLIRHSSAKRNKSGKPNVAEGDRTSQSNQSGQQARRGVKNFLHGVSYQQQLITLILCHAARRMKEDKDFRFSISTEDEEAGKFDDIVFKFWHGDKRRNLFIQAKHKQSEENYITWSDLIATANDAPLAIGKYFKSFIDQKWDDWEEPPMLVLCTNIELAEDVKGLFGNYSFEDEIVRAFFESICGKAFTLEETSSSEMHHKVMDQLRDSDFENLARLLAKHIFNKEKIGCNQPLFSKYHLAIERHIAIDEKLEGQQCRKFTEDFLNPKVITDFKSRFQEEYQKLHQGTVEDVWADVGKKGIWLTGGFYSEKNQTTDSSDLPRTIEEQHIAKFLNSFIMVCNTKNEEQLTDSVMKSLHYFFPENIPEFTNPILVCAMLSDRIFKWMVAQNSKQLQASDVQELVLCLLSTFVESLSTISVAEMKNTGLKLKQDSLQDNLLYKMLDSWLSEPISRITSHQHHYHPTFVWQVLDFFTPKLKYTFVDAKTFEIFKETILDVFHGADSPLVLVINSSIDSDHLHREMQMMSKYAPDPKSQKKILILDQSIQADEDISIQDLTAGSMHEMLAQYENFKVFGTTIPLRELICDGDGLSFLLGVKNWEESVQMKWNANEENYKKIKPMYIQRRWTYCEKANNEMRSSYLWHGTPSLSNRFRNVVNNNASRTFSIVTFLEKVRYTHTFSDIHFLNKNQNSRIPPPGGEIKEQDEAMQPDPTKVYILLNEAGSGKSYYLTWLARDLQSTHPSSWIIKFNFIEYSTDLNRLLGSSDYKTMDPLKDLKLLYRFIHMAIYVPQINRTNIADSDVERKIAQNIADVLLFSGNRVELDDDLVKSLNLTPQQLVLLRLFQSKYNSKEIVILLDGFDEIAPDYKDVALNMLSSFEKLDGVRKLYVTSRPYEFRTEFEGALQHYTFFRLEFFDKNEILFFTQRFLSSYVEEYNKMSEKNQEALVLYIHLVLISLLRDMCEIPLFLAMGLDLLLPTVKKPIILEDLSISLQILKDCEDIFELLRIMEKIVDEKLSIANTDKTGCTDATANTVAARKRDYKAMIEVKRIHSLLALYLLLNEQETKSLLLTDEQNDALNYMEEVKNGSEKSGIVEGVVAMVPMFIHRLFGEYFAALWFFSNQHRDNVKEFLKGHLYAKVERKEIRHFIDRMICKDSPLHMAVLDASEEGVKTILKNDPTEVNSTDKWGRTALCLALLDKSERSKGVIELLLDRAEETHVNVKDNYFGWHALGIAYNFDKDLSSVKSTFPFVRKLLMHGASIENEEMLSRFEHENPVYMLLNAIKFEHGLLRDCRSEKEMRELSNKIKPLVNRVTNVLISDKRLDLYSSVPQREFQAWLIFAGRTQQKVLETFFEKKDTLTLLELCAITNSTYFQSLVESAGERDKVLSNHAAHLLHLACDFYALNVVRYLVIDCKCSLPDLNTFKHVILVLVVLMNNDGYMFQTLHQRYCQQYNIAFIDEEQLRSDNIWESKEYACLITPIELFDHFPVKSEELQHGIDSGIQFLLLKAIQYDNLAAVEHLILKSNIKVSVKFITSFVQHHQLSWHCKDSYHFLLDKVENLSETDESGRDLLSFGILFARINLTKCLIEHYGLDVKRRNKKENNWSAFFYCVNSNCHNPALMRDIFSYMMEKDPVDCFDLLDSKGMSIFYYATSNNKAIALQIFERERKLVERLSMQERMLVLFRRLENGNLNNYGMLLFLTVCRLIDEESVKIVCDHLERTGDLSYTSTETGRNLLQEAVDEGWLDVVKCLIEHYGFDVKKSNEKENNWNAFFYCVRSGCKNLELMRDIFFCMMEKDSIDCFSRHDAFGKGVFYYAVSNNQLIEDAIMSTVFNVHIEDVNTDQLKLLAEKLQISGLDDAGVSMVLKKWNLANDERVT